ncbi:hypothetical protein A3I25_00250 [Candidatus Nomurabacteria bacterium RIFCSPLOWO2_02_FULL_42_17]|uniref:Ribulose-phosphate 3-epimerase n=2 Tax=Candidatus Nomuraibacteriota TaxID=1752729 RepID=A0A1F6WHM8_9BACT|nr:MAG: Ribulose-phosphate 3-epimerase [Parcubacteria group bacterium GW2011_GWA2_42_18]OGI81354.1 MAG: hypothetical protein A3B93_01220 [Candidatus Nomurabacteria bacterium RIFCSPHIGHO2_02_FULL_42_24]OGI97679.1 MAG: hypothetical protein A3I25_00250 [Candidatus Nomurabacteria bacterium RIFCSPLOWO2_02_FULL_42_17]
MIEIIPAIMLKNGEDLVGKLMLLGDFSGVVQLDLMDGIFVPEKTWMPDKLPEKDFELDLMIKNAAGRMDEWLELKPKRIIFHLEAEGNLIIPDGVEIGIAINTNTSIEKIFPFIDKINFVQCMGIEKIGYQGQPFDEKVFEQIKSLREKYPEIIISVDGGVNLETAPKLIEAGANRLVVGSAIFSVSSPATALRKFQELV